MLADVWWKNQWEDFCCYVTHLRAEAKNLERGVPSVLGLETN